MNRQVQVIGIGAVLHPVHIQRLEDGESHIGTFGSNRRNTVFMQGGAEGTPMDGLTENGFYTEDEAQKIAASAVLQ